MLKSRFLFLGLCLALVGRTTHLEASSSSQSTAVPSKTDVIVAPKRIKNATPEYPSLARQQGRSGTVNIAVVVGIDGKIAKATVVSSTDPIFVPPALAAVKQWEFTPGTKNGKPVAIAYTVPIIFDLRTR